MTIKEGYGGFPYNDKLNEAIHVCATLQDMILTISHMDTKYVQMVIDRITITGIATSDKKYRQGCVVITEALTSWMDERK